MAPAIEEPLGRELAQRVVDRISPTLRHNVNVMDPAGLIIASRDATRIGTLHAGARQAAESGAAVVIRAGDDPRAGLPGVNLPFELDGKMVGVVGLTGDPDDVMPVAEVAVLTIRLLLEREMEMDAAARREARDRDLLGRLIAGNLDASAVKRALDRSDVPLSAPWRLAALLGVGGAGTPAASTELPDGVSKVLRRTGRFHWASFEGVLWVLLGSSEHDAAALAKVSSDGGVVAVFGDECSDVGSLAGSAKGLAALVRRPVVLPAASAALHVRDLAAELAVVCMPPETARQLATRVALLTAPQRTTLQAFLDAGGSVSEAARALFAHRNTVIQRLDRIAATTGLNPRDARQALTLRLGLVATRLEPRSS